MSKDVHFELQYEANECVALIRRKIEGTVAVKYRVFQKELYNFESLYKLYIYIYI
jgi:hypothetical protein